jgi:hypothetical protein
MARKELGIRGLDGSLLARMRGIIKMEYGKTKDREGSITARTINGLLFSWVELHKDKSAAKRKTRTTALLEAIIQQMQDKEIVPEYPDHHAAIINIIQRQSGTTELRTIIKYVSLLERADIFDEKQRERIINKAYSLYGATRKSGKHNNDEGLLIVQTQLDKDGRLFEALGAAARKKEARK